MEWWLWAIGGIGLLALEMATPGGLVAIFFAAGALLVAPLAAIGLDPLWQWVLFSAVSVASLLLVRGTLRRRLALGPAQAVDTLLGEEVVLLEDLPAGGQGKAELRGAPWIARAAPGVALRAGQRCRVERVEGVTLWVRSDEKEPR